MARSYTLALEGATYEGSVALMRDSEVVAERTLRADDGGSPRAGRGERLMPAVAECLEDAGVGRAEIARIVCGSGPGSFTSLRVAGSVAKGLAAGYGVELYSVSSLVLTASGAQPSLPIGEYLSVLDAMRDEFFAARIILGPGGVAIQGGPATLISATAQLDQDGIEHLPGQSPAPKCRLDRDVQKLRVLTNRKRNHVPRNFLIRRESNHLKDSRMTAQ